MAKSIPFRISKNPLEIHAPTINSCDLIFKQCSSENVQDFTNSLKFYHYTMSYLDHIDTLFLRAKFCILSPYG